MGGYDPEKAHPEAFYPTNSNLLDKQAEEEMAAIFVAVVWGSLILTGAIIPLLIWRRWKRAR